MYCYQCEQTAKGSACTVQGVCGKDGQTAALQDLLTYALIGLSQTAKAGLAVGVNDHEANVFTCLGLFSTLTNVNFDPDRFAGLIKDTVAKRTALAEKVKAAGGTVPTGGPASFSPAGDLTGLEKQAAVFNFEPKEGEDANIRALRHLIIFGLRGLAAYAHHAEILGQEDDLVYHFVHEALASVVDDSLDLNDYLGLTLKTGEVNIRAMELLDAGNTGTYGHPVPTSVPLGAKAGKAILVSGHDLRDLAALLEQTEGKGINIYTHGEMLPTHGYPELKKYAHFHGHYGTAWQNQKAEFSAFPGPILMTTNCIQRPAKSYVDSIWTAGPVGWPGVRHIADRNFKPLIDQALAMPGFVADEDKGSVMVGFARNAVLGVADKVIEAVKSGAIKHFFLVAGCDGAKPGRNYYTEFVEKAPQDTVILTLACGKFRFFDKQLGDIGGIPRLLDIGQCNDAYSAVQIAVALANAFETDVNSLPLSMILSWYEQKACAILLSLLHLGITGIRLGPSLPAFITPDILNVLVEKFQIKPIGSVEEDMKACLAA